MAIACLHLGICNSLKPTIDRAIRFLDYPGIPDCFHLPTLTDSLKSPHLAGRYLENGRSVAVEAPWR